MLGDIAIGDCWGAATVRAKPSLLPPDLTDRDRGSLVEVGFPTTLPFFVPDPLDQEPLVRVASGSRRLLRLGSDLATSICLDPDQASVVSVDPSGGHSERFVNSDVRAFQRCLCSAVSFYARTKKFDDRAAIAEVPRLIAEMSEIDERAFDDPEHWWAVIAEQMSFALL